MQIGPYPLANNLALAPMAGITDRPFRELCRRYGAGWVVGEMQSADASLRETHKSRSRRVSRDEAEPRVVQVVGSEPGQLAEAARFNVARGAQVIDINLGCPAKKVCRKAAGSALLADEARVAAIFRAVVAAVEVPVTAKIRTGVEPARRNGVRIAELAQREGIRALAVHGRTRADLYRGRAEYATIRQICAAVDLPIWANGDIRSPEQAGAVLEETGADGVMIGRGAQGRPWLFAQVAAWLARGERLPDPPLAEVAAVVREHLDGLYALHGELRGARVARKHVGWYLAGWPGGREAAGRINRAECPAEQQAVLAAYFRRLEAEGVVAA